MKDIFTKSDGYIEEYSASIVKIGKLEPIDGSDNLLKTLVNGYQVIVDKTTHEGDIMVYIKNETEVNSDFLKVNNQYEIVHPELNANYEEVKQMIDELGEEEANKIIRKKNMAGYFGKNSRLRMVKLRGCQSYGMLVGLDTIMNWDKTLKENDFIKNIKYDKDGNIIPFNFDTINGKLFCKVYIPPMKEYVGDGKTKFQRKADRFDRMIPGQFLFHYHTNMLAENMWQFNPDTDVAITLKMHGTSVVIANVLTKHPLTYKYIREYMHCNCCRGIKNFFKNVKEVFKLLKKGYYVDYDNVTSSHNVIKNKTINKHVKKGYYDIDIWSQYGKLLYPYLDKGMTVYGEICGYIGKNDTLIQKGYDYSCKPNENFLMPYRITINNDDGTRTEYDVQQVYDWTTKLICDHPELMNCISPIHILYNGRFGNLYPDVNPQNHWNENVLEKLKNDKENFLMELNEPFCNNKVPREGIVVRINGNPEIGAFKLKTDAFYARESKMIDKGEVDIELQETTN